MQVSHLNPIPVSISNVIPDLVQIVGIIRLQREPTSKAVDHHLKTNLHQQKKGFRIGCEVLMKISDLFHLVKDTPDCAR